MQEYRELALYRFERAHQTLTDAEKFLGEVSLQSTVNRLYYALFYAVSGLLITKRLSSPKHTGVRALLNREFVKPGLVSPDLGRFYSAMFDKRHKGDYEDYVTFEHEDVREWLEQGRQFVAQLEVLAHASLDSPQIP